MSLSGFTHPWWFLLLLVVVGLAAGYVVAQRLRRRRTLRFSNLALLDKVAPKSRSWWLHVPAAVLLVSLLVLTVALAGPTGQQRVPRNRATVMLVIDVSLSMEATDVAPSRLQAAQVAAKQFTDGLPTGLNLGLISFAGSATVLVSPTTDHASVDEGIDALKLGPATATGVAIDAALQSIQQFGKELSGVDGAPPARIVLMSDGKQTMPTMDPSDAQGAFTAAGEAARQNVPVSTISFGTDYGTVDIQGTQEPVPVDDDLLRQVAQISHGDFFKAVTEDELKQVYASLRDEIGYTTEETDASRPWLILGTLLAIIAAGGAIAIGQRLP
ncbi:MAG TPA: VWA domain-containing protein [Pseudonocardiaceae bacterium]|nr:VWA domain-containing protein [Pseudonocardiaceae bacterium]